MIRVEIYSIYESIEQSLTDNAYEEDLDHVCLKGENEPVENPMIFFPYAIVQPLAMMIKSFNAPVAYIAMP
jgi:hypothetical protein